MVLDVRVFMRTIRIGVFPWTMIGLGVSMDWFVWTGGISLTCFWENGVKQPPAL